MRLAGLLRKEAQRRLLWLPVALAGGIGGYFALPVEPPSAAGPAGVALTVVLTLATRHRPLLCWLAMLGVAAAVGFTAAEVRTRTVATVMLHREIWVAASGRIVAIERRPADWRLTLDRVVLGDAAVEDGTVEKSAVEKSAVERNAVDRAAPSGVRVTVTGRARDAELAGLRTGDRVALRARLRPPPAPVAPGAFDFQRAAYFKGIGAVGFGIGGITVLERAPAGWADGPRAAIERIRSAATARVRAGLPGPVGAIAAAMLVGDRAGIDEPTAAAFRETGLAHLLAISGLHMGLVAGTVFALVRITLSAWPAVVLRRPIKKWAAGVALVAAAGYLVLAGAPVPTQRAFLMTGLVLVAVLLDREAVSLHLVGWAAAAVLLLTPESLTGPSFQLSFAAVTGLIAVWEALSRRHRSGRRNGVVVRAARYVAAVAGTSLVASLVTAPVVAHHFQQVPVLGALANLAAVPLTAFVTMPAGIAALLTLPVGLEAWPLRAMGWGIGATLWVAERASQGPLTAIGVAALETGPMVALALGGLWLALWRTAIRWAGLAAIAAGLVAAGIERPPDVLISADGDVAAVRLPDRGWAMSGADRNRFLRDAWRRRWGGAAASSFLAADQAADGLGLACDGVGCVLRLEGRVLALPSSPEAAVEDCTHADVVVTTVRLRADCPGRVPVVDRDDLRRDGAHAIWLTPGGVRIRSTGRMRGDRPWVVQTSGPRVRHPDSGESTTGSGTPD